MSQPHILQVDSRGMIRLPASVRKEDGVGPHSQFLLFKEAVGEYRLIVSETRPKREYRMYTNEEIAQTLIDGALTPDEIEDAHEGIRKLGLNPDDFKPNL